MISIKALLTKICEKLKSIDEVVPRANRVYTATCSTQAGTGTKVVTLEDHSDTFALADGVKVLVYFSYGNSATTPQLNVSSKGARDIVMPYDVSSYSSGNGTTYNTWAAGETLLFTYKGNASSGQWVHQPSGRLGYITYAMADSKAPKASPTFTGTPVAPTATAGTNTTQIATTAFVQTAITNIGSKASGSSSSDVSIPTSTYTPICSVSLAAGTWLVTGTCHFTTNTSGVRRLNISSTSAAQEWKVSYPAGDAQLKYQVTEIVSPTSTTTYYLNAWQNSGSTLTNSGTNGKIEAVRIK